ncbi:multidrug transporter subunit MdtN [Serratia marcescens]|uniref:multidrug transporter subunit MdtN n=1 Tax=Serratia marcescens TaxID=615 RepID=UPI0013DC23EE|nr:multidrug transporter subunit MdtN [Serratia marcescens]MBH3215781.1 multidrug transporter subunit MdtN [Serratia marcescens]MBN5317801.1 multidrug transporter subunit MdtN [Serratia marcescens]BEO48392.1 multidrug resistance protein MdtN [Serratia marcescens]
MTQPQTSNKRRLLVLTILALTLIVAAAVVWRVENAPTTDDAYAYADTIDVVPEVNGRIIEMPIRDNQEVRQGDLLFRIDPRPYQDALAASEARLIMLNEQIKLTQRSVNAQQYNAESMNAIVKRSQALVAQATDTLNRRQKLLGKNYVSAEEVETARTSQRSAQAELQAALLQAKQAEAAVSGVEALVAQRAEVQADIAIAKLNLEFTEVRAPFDGRIASLKTTVGQYASSAKPVFTLIDTRHWYVVANFRETDLKGVHPGVPATLYLMSDAGQTFSGKVESISYGVQPDDGGTVLGGLPNVSRNINWVHVSQRFPVKIAVEAPNSALFRVGASAVAKLNLRHEE